MIIPERKVREAWHNLQLAGPATLAMLVLIFFPAFIVGILSFTDYLFGASSFNWVGIDNYVALLGDETGRRAVVNTLIYVAVVMPSSIVLSLIAAIGIHSVSQWSMGTANFLRTAYFMPVVATLVAMATVWQMLLHRRVGKRNLSFIGSTAGSGRSGTNGTFLNSIWKRLACGEHLRFWCIHDRALSILHIDTYPSDGKSQGPIL